MRPNVSPWIAWALAAVSALVAALFTIVSLPDAPEETRMRVLLWIWGAPATLVVFAAAITILRRLE